MKLEGTEDVERRKENLRQTGTYWNKACLGQMLVLLLAVLLKTLSQFPHAYQSLDMGRGIVHFRRRNVVGHKIAESCLKTGGNLVARQMDTADMVPWADDIRSCDLGKDELEARTDIETRWRTAADIAVASPTAGM